MKIKNIDHFVILSANLEATLKFYGEILDLEIVQNGAKMAVKFGDSKINIHQKLAEFLPVAKNQTYGSADFCLIAQGDIDEIAREITSRGAIIELGPVERTGALGKMKSVYLYDPDGNLVEISVY
ncbi:VOC family protein [Campylobacter sp. JMF_06 NA1]|uniref:VOC family protein n=1 Tax=Campylobacter sp. JMF_06 NA1 TaxID=2983823 RepID=UPI0022E9A653|nr:VOC family protein [Campylobacter sp. JMF_06 NA1]MDA3078542.1 VOC family protein [Campylobacter sp. JMF_06 NA1]